MGISCITLLPKWAPNVHPVLVHFPIGILLLAVLMDFLTFFISRDWWNEHTVLITYGLGAVLLFVAFFTGQMAPESLPDLSKSAQQALDIHAAWATASVWFFTIYVFARLIVTFVKRLKGRGVHLILFAISLIGVFLLYETAKHGGELVYKKQLGVRKTAYHVTTQKGATPLKSYFGMR